MQSSHGAEPSRPPARAEPRATARRLRGLALAAPLVLASLGPWGCAGGGDEAEQGLVVLVDRRVRTLDPRFVGDPVSLRATRLLHAGLMRVDPYSLEVVPDLAESVRWHDERTLLVTLRAGLRFSDGAPLSARDVAATFEGIVDPALGSRYAVTYRRIERVEVLDARRLRFVLRGPHAPLWSDLEIPVLPARFGRRRLPEDPGALVGAGPYRLVGARPGALRLEASPTWHGPVPRWPRVTLLTVADAASRALRLLAGRADLAVGTVPPAFLPVVAREPSLQVRSVPGVTTLYVGLRMDRPPLDEPRVREALLLALDRERLVAGKLGGRGTVAAGWVPPGHWASDPSLRPRPFDPARARALLDAAGYPDPDGPGGRPRLRLELRVASERGRLSVARALAALWRRTVDVEVAVRPSEPATLFSDLQRGRFQMALMRSPEVIEPHVLAWFFASDRIPRDEGSGGANRWRLRDPALDRALEAGRVATDRAARRAAYRRVQRILAARLPVLPLWHEHVVTVASPRAAAFQPPRDGRLGPLAWPLPTKPTP